MFKKVKDEVKEAKEKGLAQYIKDEFKEVDRTNELCEYLRKIGVEAEVLDPKSPEAIHHTPTGGIFGNPPIGCVKIKDRNLDLIEIYRTVRSTPMSRGRQYGRHYGTEMVYTYNYAVRTDVGDLENELKVETKPIKKGLFGQRVIDFQWGKPENLFLQGLFGSTFGWILMAMGLLFIAVGILGFLTAGEPVPDPTMQRAPIMVDLLFSLLGLGMTLGPLIWQIWHSVTSRREKGRLAQLLNDDSELRNILLKTGMPHLRVNPNKKDQYAGITPLGIRTAVMINGVPVKYSITVGGSALPTREAIEAYDRIARHILGIAPAQH